MEELQVLIVEDRPEEAELVRIQLTRATRDDGPRLTIHDAGTGAEAIERVTHHKPDVILLDLGLPDMDGVETFRAIQSAAPYTPIVIHSGYTTRDVAVACIEAGAQDFIRKSDMGPEDVLRTLLYAVIRVGLKRGADTRLRGLAERVAALI